MTHDFHWLTNCCIRCGRPALAIAEKDQPCGVFTGDGSPEHPIEFIPDEEKRGS